MIGVAMAKTVAKVRNVAEDASDFVAAADGVPVVVLMIQTPGRC
jgi:magnesium-transporting ATPase (P-type)